MGIFLIFPRLAQAAASFTSFTNVDWTNAVAREGDYLWTGSSGGLVIRRLSDGAVAKLTTANSDLIDNVVQEITIDANGRKWLGTINGMAVFDDNGTPLNLSDDSWQSFTGADGLLNGNIFTILIDSAGRKWITHYGGVNVFDDGGTPFDKSDDQWQGFRGAEDMNCPVGAAWAISIDSASRKWVGCVWDGVRVLDDGGTPFIKTDDQWQSFTDSDGMASNLISGIAIDNAGRKWIASFSSPGGASVLDDHGTPFDKSDDQWQNFSSADSGLANNRVDEVLIDAAGLKWYVTNGGVSVLDDNGTPITKSDDQWITFTPSDGLAESWLGRLSDIIIDASGIKWIATIGGGVSQLNDAGTPFTKSDDAWQTYALNDQLANNSINTMTVDTSGFKWIGTYGGGINVLDDNGTPADQTDDRWQTFSSRDRSELSEIIYGITIDASGRKWIGGHDYKLIVLDDRNTPFDKADDQWGVFTSTGASDPRVPIINSITLDTAGRKWLAAWGSVTVLDDHGTPFDQSDDQWIAFTSADGLVDNMVWSITLDSAGRKWISTRGGVSVLNDNNTPFDKSDDQWVSFTGADAPVPAGMQIGLMNIDAGGKKWLSTNGGGFCVLDDQGTLANKADDHWQCFTTADGSGTDYPQAILIEPSGRKWITGGGLTLFDDRGTLFDKTDDRYLTFHAADGLTSEGTFVLTPSGQNLWVGTAGGVSVLLDYLSVTFNSPPTANAGGPYTLPEGGAVSLSGSGSDSDGNPLTYAWDLDNNGTFETPGQSAIFSAASLDGPSSQTVVLQVCDNQGACAINNTNVDITNVAPTVGTISAPSDPQPVNTSVSATTSFTDPGVLDTHTALWNWGDGTTSAGNVNAGAVSGTHTYVSAGVYELNLTVTDKDNGSGQAPPFQYVVIFDSTAGFATGAGMIDSPAGAYPQGPTLTGRAHFGFSVKYLPGDTTPNGGSQFKFKIADINFSSTSYQWLVISGTKATFKGIGTNNGQGNYAFLVSTIDTEPDRYRIKITDNSTNLVFYDNEMNVPETADPTTPLVNGNIVIH